MATLWSHENIPGIGPDRRGGDAQARPQYRGKVLQRVDSQLDPVAQKGLVELPGKDALTADLVNGLIEALVA